MSNNEAITTPDIKFIYDPPNNKEKKVLLLTTGKIATVGKWGNGVGVIGWHPLPKRNKQKEKLMEILKLSGLIKQWAHDRNLINGSTAEKQALKFMSEAGELARNLNAECQDDIGDCMVVLIIMAEQKGYCFNSILDLAHSELIRIPNLNSKEQYIMMSENVGLLMDNLLKNNDCHDHIAMVIANLISLADRKAYGIELCIQTAYNDIKDRVGIMYKGAYIKSTDPRYESAKAEIDHEDYVK